MHVFTLILVLVVCGGTLVARENPSRLYSHAKYGDQNYNNKENCSWVIWGDGQHRIRFKFLSFEVEDEQNCR